MRRQQLTEAQITALLDPPTDQRELVRHYTLMAADLAAIRRCRGDHNRLGHALMLCYLRYPGRPLRARERPPRPLLLFIANQIDALPGSIEDYLAGERNRQRHVAELQDRLGLRPFGTRPAADLADWLLPHAIENDRLAHLAGLVVEECRRRRIIVPSPGALERLCVQARYQARGEVQRRLTDGLSADQRRRLDALTQRRAETTRPAGLDGGLAYPGRDLCLGAPASDQPAAARAACGGVWRWLRLLLGWPVLSGRRFRSRREQHQCPLRR